MKKLLGILVLGLLLSGCSTTEGNLYAGKIKIGQTKSSFCYAVVSFKFKSDPCMDTSSLYYDSDTKKEILSDSYKEIFFVFKNVNRRTKGHGGPKKHGDGVLEKILYNYQEAKEFASKKEIVKKTTTTETDTTKETTTTDEKKVEAASGSAFFISNTGYIITNFHVVATCNDNSKIFYRNNEVNAKLIAKDEYLDLALLKAEVNNTKFITISNMAPKKLQRIIAAGYPFGKYLSDDMKFTSGIVSSLKGIMDDSTRLQIDAALNKGNSGGPIVDENTGELVAVAVAGLRKDISEAVNYGIKAGSVKNFLESNQIDPSTFSKKFSTGDVAELLESSVLYTFCK